MLRISEGRGKGLKVAKVLVRRQPTDGLGVTELRVAVVLRSRALGPMLTASAGELWPFCARSVHDSAAHLDRPRPLVVPVKSIFSIVIPFIRDVQIS